MPSFIWKFGCREYCEPFFWLVVYLKLQKEDFIFDFNLWNLCYSRNFVLRWAEYHASPVKVILSAFSQLWPSNYVFAHLRTESEKNCKKSEWKVKEIRGIFGKFQMAASVRILRISASYSTQRLFRMSDWRI